MQTSKVKRLGDILIEKGYITPDNFSKAMEIKKKSPGDILGEIIIREKFATDFQVLEAIGSQLDLPFTKLSPNLIDQNIIKVIPISIMERYIIVPMYKVMNEITIAMADPANLFIIEEITNITNCQVNVVVATSQDILESIEVISPHVKEFDNEIDPNQILPTPNNDSLYQYQNLDIDENSPVIKYVNDIISTAIKSNVSDIHFECDDQNSKIRFRIDGILYNEKTSPINMHAGIVSRIKILANMDIGEKRLPQDGRIQTFSNQQQIDMRVSTIPTNHGEKVVIRLLFQNTESLSLSNINLEEGNLEKIRKEMQKPHGLFLVTGPTGSGKTTMMYSALKETADITKNVCTVENPIEYDLDAINQMQINYKAGLTFPICLRAILRQDPDVVMIGEIRDKETADIAIQAALTGHLVLSTLHTNNTFSTVTRLMNMGLEPFLLGASINAILAQRLVRKVCNYCREEILLSRALIDKLEIDEDNAYFFKGRGCPACHGTGYKGRLAIHELFVLNNDARDVISKGPTIEEVREVTERCNTVPLRLDGLLKAYEGLTTVEEIVRVTEDNN